ncbi:MAG TPA: hypothetical protein VE972_12535 [Conexibacter sp.]|nr:hypothetical protein [Conexibacter sp.]
MDGPAPLTGDRARPAVDAHGLELLRRHAPILRFDSMESLRPCAIDAFVDASIMCEYVAHDDSVAVALDGSGLERLAAAGEPCWQLDPLGERRPEGTARRSAALLAEFRAAQDPRAQGLCYGSVVETARAYFLQYWLFYVDNPCVLGFGRHDGDWESVQVRVGKRAGRATHVTVSQHGGPETRRMPAGQSRPEVFVAVDSHASYLVPGSQPMLPLSDVCDGGQRPEIDLVVEPLPAAGWPLWRGRWGVDRGPGTLIAHWLHLRWTPALLRLVNRRAPAGDSPVSPGWQSNWPSPARTQARSVLHTGTRVAPHRFAHWLGNLTWPKSAPALHVVRAAPDLVTVRAEPSGRGLRRVRRVALLFHEQAGLPLAHYAVRADGELHTLELPASTQPLAWRAAGYNRLRQRGLASASLPLPDSAAPDVAADAAAA